MKQDEKNAKAYFLLPWQHVRSQATFLLFLKYSFNYLTGKQFHTVAVKNCSRSASVIQSKRNAVVVLLGTRK